MSLLRPLLILNCCAASALATLPVASKPRILFFTKSSGYEHSVISWKKGRPSHAESVLLKIAEQKGWDFTFSKDGRIFDSPELKEFRAVFFYTTGNLLEVGTDGNPPMSAQGKQALFDFVRSGRGFIGTHSASDTFHTANESKKGPDRFRNHGQQADPYVRFLGAEFIKHGAQQMATNRIVDSQFPGFQGLGKVIELHEEWYSLKDFSPDLHVLTIMETAGMKGSEYARPNFPSTWARREGSGRVWYTSMGHREDVWLNPAFQQILIGGIDWALGDSFGDTPANLNAITPGAMTNPPYTAPTKPTAEKAPKGKP